MGNRIRAVENLGVNRRFWSGRRVMVTGHTGFKGAWLTLWLRAMGADVMGYALAPGTKPALFEAANVAEGIDSRFEDVRNYDAVLACMAEFKPEVVLHLAAQALVRESYANPVDTYAINVMGTVNVLNAVRSAGSVKSVVIVTSDKCYENREWMWGYREDEPMGGHDPYSSSKGCAELVTAAYTRSFFAPEKYSEHGVALASARAGNVIGGGDWAADRLVPDVVRAFQMDQPVIVRNPTAVRPWQYVLEPLRGYLMLAEALYEKGPEYAGGWNFGPGNDDTKPVSWLVERAAGVWGGGASWSVDTGEQPHEAHYLKLDCSKAAARLGWRPITGLAQALDWTIEWYREFYEADGDRDAARRMAIEAICRYGELPTC